MTENFPYVVCLKPFNQMVNLFMLNDTFCNFANWHVSGDWRVCAATNWAGKAAAGHSHLLFVVCT